MPNLKNLKKKAKRTAKKTANLAQKGLKLANQLSDEDFLDKVAHKIGDKVGKKVGNEQVGRLLTTGLLKVPQLVGMGDYNVTSNTLFRGSGFNPNGVVTPKFVSTNRGVRIMEREFVGNVSGFINFNNASYVVNPSNATAFPWLSTIANQFDQWEPNGIVYEFKSTSSDYNGAGQSLGTVAMTCDYDVSDPLYANKIEAENSDFAISAKPSCSILCGLECDPKERPTRLLYTGIPPANRDPKLYNLANFQFITQGLQSIANIGELWVTYDITLYKKQLVTPGRYCIYKFTTANATPATPFVNAPTSSFEHGMNCNLTGSTSYTVPTNQIFLPNVSGTFDIKITVGGAALTTATVSLINCASTSTKQSVQSGIITESYSIVTDITNYSSNPPIIQYVVAGTSIAELVFEITQISPGETIW